VSAEIKAQLLDQSRITMTACDYLFTCDMNLNNTTHDEIYLNDRMESEDGSWIL